MQILSKIWNLGGVFYISLVLSLIIYLFSSEKVKKIIAKSIVILGLFFSLFYSIKASLFTIPNQLFLSARGKIDKDSIGQYTFAQKAKQVLPPNSSGCVLRSWDTPTAYLIEELYPNVFVPIDHYGDTSPCDYLITQFKPFPDLSDKLVFEFGGNYIYKITH